MVEKIYITPGNVRGLGNIVSLKSTTDWTGNYANVTQDTNGNFILSYEGLLLKFNTSLASTIKDMEAYLYCTVLLEEDNSPVEDLTVTCTFEDATVLTETTDSEGEVTFTWTPTSLGEETVTINCSNQGDYASHTQTVDIRIGLLLNFYEIMTGLTCEDDEYYEGTFEENIENRVQLSTFIKDIYVADGGERCITSDGLVYIAEPGDLVVEYDNLDQDSDYASVIFEEEVEVLTGAVCSMGVSVDDEIVLTRLERSDIIGGVSVGLSVSSSSISVGESVVLTAEVLSDGEPVSGETVSFYDGTSLLGTDETDSDGLATYTASSLSVGSHSLTASALDKSSTTVTVTVNKLTSTITLSVPSTGTVGTSYTVSGTLTPTSGSVKLYENNVLKDTLTVSSGSFSKAITQSNEGTYSYYAVFEGSSTYSSVTSSTGSIVVSDVPTPTVDSVSLTADKSILSYADSQSATLSATVLDSNDDPMEGVTVTFYNGSTSMGTADTNSSGVATKTYASTGAGDLSFTASVGTISSETYSIIDAFKYIANGSQTYGSSLTFTNLADVNSLTDYEISIKLKSTQTKAFGIAIKQSNNNTNTYLIRTGFNSDPNADVVVLLNQITEHYPDSNHPPSANTFYDMKIKRENGVYTCTTDGYSHSVSSPPSNLRYIGLESWSVSKTLEYTDFIVKPL